MTTWPRFLAAAAAAAALGSGCAGDDGHRPGSGELTGPTHYRKVCVAPRTDDYTIGVATAENAGTAPLTLESARLTDVRELSLVEVEVIRPRDLVDSFGVWNGYPPSGLDTDPLSARLWRSRSPLESNRVEPGERVNFVLHLRGGAGAGSGPLEVTYRAEDGDGERTWTSNVEYGIGGGQCSFTDE